MNLLISNLILLIFELSNVETQIYRWMSLIIIIVLSITLCTTFIIRRIEDSAVAIAIAVLGTVALAPALAGVISGALALALTLVVAVTGTIALAGVIAGAIALVVVVTETIAGAIPLIVAVTGTIAGVLSILITITITIAETGMIAGASRIEIVNLVVVLFQILLSSWIAYRAIKGDEKYTSIYNISIALSAISGTSFRDANLTDTDFSNATLKSTDFRGANITHTFWRNAIKLDLILPGKTYLKDAKVRKLVRTGEGQDKNFDRLDFRGINLKEANLQDASFDGTDLNRANLQNANLSRAKLVQTLLEGADLTGATLTGACVEDWAISNTTELININCDYIFLKYPDRERRPADSDKYFEPGEFAKLAQKIPNTVDLIFKDGIDWQTFLKTFEELRVESETGELPVIQTIENKGDGAFVIRVKVPDQIDEAEYERKFWQKYKPMLELKDREIKLLSEQKDFYSEEIKNIRKENTRLIGVVETMAEKEAQESKIYVGENYGVVGKEGEIHGVVGKEVENYGVVGKEGKIKDSKIARTIYEAQPKTLAETAAEIQQLLQQLEQSNPTETTAGKMAIVTQAVEIVENNPTLKQRVIGVLKSAGTEAFKEALDNPIANILVAAFQGWIEP